MNTEEPQVLQKIKEMIDNLKRIIRMLSDLRDEIIDWYHKALLDLASELNVEDELFDITNALYVEGIEYNAIVEALCEVMIFHDSKIESFL